MLISAVVISAVEFEKARKDEKRRDDVRLAACLGRFSHLHVGYVSDRCAGKFEKISPKKHTKQTKQSRFEKIKLNHNIKSHQKESPRKVVAKGFKQG